MKKSAGFSTLLYLFIFKCIESSSVNTDDGSGINPLEVYNFGKAASFLFRPCQNADGSEDEVGFHTFWVSFVLMLMSLFFQVTHAFCNVGKHRNVIFDL